MAEGLRSLDNVLRESLPSEFADWQLTDARAVSADGRTVVGFGINPAGEREGWIATLSTLPQAAEQSSPKPVLGERDRPFARGR